MVIVLHGNTVIIIKYDAVQYHYNYISTYRYLYPTSIHLWLMGRR